MTSAELLGARPTHVPPGYRFIRALRGRLFEGFPGDDEQEMLVYGRGWSDADARRTLLVHLAPPTNASQLFGTEEQPGQPVDIQVEGVRGIYHDGRWELGPGTDARDTGHVVLHWDTSEWHSVTAVHAGGTYAVRGSALNGVTFHELVAVIQSLPY